MSIPNLRVAANGARPGSLLGHNLFSSRRILLLTTASGSERGSRCRGPRAGFGRRRGVPVCQVHPPWHTALDAATLYSVKDFDHTKGAVRARLGNPVGVILPL